jgi:hypothetical protein
MNMVETASTHSLIKAAEEEGISVVVPSNIDHQSPLRSYPKVDEDGTSL